MTPGFMVIHGNQPELLRQLLVHWFKAYPLNPLEDETVLVQSNGIAQWLKLALAANTTAEMGGGCGIAASLEMLLPSRFIWQAYRSVLGHAAVPDASPFDKPLLIWRLMRLLPDLVSQPGYEPLARFLKGDSDLRKRFQLSEKIADLFDQYQVYRADWLDAWSKDQDILISGKNEARTLESHHRWQPMLWRALLDDVGQTGQTGRASIHQRFLDTIRTLDERPPALPRRVSVFGLSSLPRQSLEVLLAISRFSQVLLCVHNPCEHYWANLLSDKDHARRSSGRHKRKENAPEIISDEELHLHAHPLLASWGRQGRDYIALLDELDNPTDYQQHFEAIGERINLFESHGTSNLLNQLQDDIRLLRSTTESRKEWPAVSPEHDRSVRFHVAHSTQREVEILQDQLLAAFNADESLRPRDIIVMVPDVNQYAPHIEAVFGQIDRSDPRYIPFSIADLAKRQQAPLVFALEFLLGVTESRLAVTDLLDLLDVPAVQQRFGIATNDLPLLHQWIEQSNIRWGLNADHRAQFTQTGFEQNTWILGLKRMLLGYAVGSDPSERENYAWHGIEPYGEVSGLDAALVGPLARLLIQLQSLTETFATPATPTAWYERLQGLLEDFFACENPEDTSLLLKLQSSLQTWVDACDAAGLDEALPLAVIREHWLAQIDQPTLAQRFMAGKLTFATLMPMRAIPFRMVCLLGMNDGEFPRSRPPVDFDLMAQDFRPGDRSRREDDRYLFLEALLSARERLHISWVGKSIHDNSDRPPSVLVSQLRDHINACWQLAGDAKDSLLASALTVEHHLQGFNRDYFGKDPENSPHFTYAKEWERRIPSTVSNSMSALPLSLPILEAPISLHQLSGFLKDPVKTFFNERLGVYYTTDTQTSNDYEPFALDGLEQWSLQDQLIRARLDALIRGEDEAEAVQRQLGRIQRGGQLPLGGMADLLAETLVAPLDPMFDYYRNARANWPTPLEDQTIDHTHSVGGLTLNIQGRVTLRYANDAGRCRIELNSSDLLKDKKYRRDKLLVAWIAHLAAHLDGQPMTTIVIGKNGEVPINPLDPGVAAQHLNTIIEAYIQGLCSPLPLAPEAGFAWLEKGGVPYRGAINECTQPAVGAARGKYEDGYKHKGEASLNAYLERLYPSLELLWSDGHFTELCANLYGPLMSCVGKTKDPQ